MSARPPWSLTEHPDGRSEWRCGICGQGGSARDLDAAHAAAGAHNAVKHPPRLPLPDETFGPLAVLDPAGFVVPVNGNGAKP